MIEHASWSSFWAMRTSQLCFPNSDWVQPLRSDEIIMIIWLSFVTNTHDRSERTLMINCHRGASRPSPTSHLTHAPEREKERERENETLEERESETETETGTERDTYMWLDTQLLQVKYMYFMYMSCAWTYSCMSFINTEKKTKRFIYVKIMRPLDSTSLSILTMAACAYVWHDSFIRIHDSYVCYESSIQIEWLISCSSLRS